MFSADLDSINVTGSGTSRMLNFWGRGSLANSYNVSTVDSVKVFRSDDEPLVYLGIVGFNQELYPKAVDILASSTSNLYTSFVSNLERKAGTLLYYGVDQALDILTKYDFSTPLSSVNLITFTDGLDQGSLMMNSNYQTDGAYLQALSKRISSTKIRGLKLTAYSLGLRGNDVSDYAQFQTNLRQLATTEDKAIEVSSMYDVENRLQEIADQIISISNRQKISMKIPGVSNGTRIRFTFDGNSPEYSTMYIEGTFNLSDRSLRNVNYYGMRASSGSFIRGEQDGIFVTFTFTGLQRTDGSGLIPTNYIRQYNKATSSSAWQNNSEFSPSNNTQTTITHSGAAIMLVLDCSSSLGSQFSNMKNYAQNFISRVAQNAAPLKLEAPTNVVAELGLEESHFIVNVSWDTMKYAEYYQVYRSSSSSGSWTLMADSLTTNTWTDTAPLSSDNYYRVYSMGHCITSLSGSTSEGVVGGLTAPKNVTASLDDNDLIIHVNWDSVKFAESYVIYRNGFLIAEGLTSTSWTDKSPRSGNNYYSVKAVGQGTSSWSSNNTPNINCSLAAPTNIICALDNNDMIIHVSWDAVKYAETYTIYRNGTEIATGVGTNSWKDEYPLSGPNYYTVRAECHRIISSISDRSDTVDYYLATPSNVTAALDENDLIIHISWDSVKFAESYVIYRNASLIAEGITSTSWTDKSPWSGNNSYSVKAVGHGTTSLSSNYTSSIKCSLAAPTNVSATLGADEKTIRLTWDAVRFAESYTVWRSNDEKGVFSFVAEGVTSTSWTDEKPGYGSKYYQVVAEGRGLRSVGALSNMVKIQYIVNPEDNIQVTVNGIQFTMIKVEGGTFQMGGDMYDGEKPVHQVTLTNDYYIGETEVTQELWTAVMGSNPSSFKGSNQLPVERVSWNDCKKFITKLKALTGRTFRLPTEAEWEFAARGGNASEGYTYSGSNTLGDVAWYWDNIPSQESGTTGYGTQPVATKAPNELGIYDMSGNVWEWCQDLYGSYSGVAQTNPKGSDIGDAHVIRGGSWYYGDNGCRVASRFAYYESHSNDYLGLRLAL